jgi:hypothetical protein
MTILGMTFDGVFVSKTITRHQFVAVSATSVRPLLSSVGRHDRVRRLLNIE